MTVFECWVGLCEEKHTEIWELEKHGDISLYMTKNPYMYQNREYSDTPVFHVWNKDHCCVTTTNYLNAYRSFKNQVKEGDDLI